MTDKNMGWQCPHCLVVYAPSVDKCECSVLPKKYTGSISGYFCDGYISTSPNGICSKCALPEWKHYNLTTI